MQNLLEVQGLSTAFCDRKTTNRVVEDVSFSLRPGETLGLVGESGSGKSVTSLSILRLLDPKKSRTEGKVLLEGRNLLALPEREMEQVRGGSISMVFQDSMTSLNPVFTVGYQLMEAIRIHQGLSKEECRARAVEMLERVGLPEPEQQMKKYPFTLSGGQQQRVMIAMALSCHPKVLIADEPTTALDVTIQAQIVQLLRDLQRETGMAIILVTHDIGLIAEMADRVLVMYAGQVVEESDVQTLFQNPAHPYTRALMRSVPTISDSRSRKLESIPGAVPERYQQMTGCRFASRCAQARPECAVTPQPLWELAPGHRCRCQFAGR